MYLSLRKQPYPSLLVSLDNWLQNLPPTLSAMDIARS